ncbi:MAG: Cys-tRNA(Pro) deacylase [Lachnospiraceae bacterium]|jgi:Cys-tRNA(Pro)/Cys-tRNA(Cys) deacylase|nr:Cys-tRNA(Pro) deacylase [Lachnospiraceae bacterium]MCI1726353.1 Cys-tRNA(Pro) deacylase [Lachnospiraceae bacterium]
MAKEKDIKTNAMRILDRMKISYEVLTYEVPEFVDGVQVADIEGVPHETSFKTLVAEGRSGSYFVFVIPIEKEVDLKAAARAVGEKSVELIHVKDITKITGYVRGGCSPLGMKKPFPTVISSEAKNFSRIYVSGGRIGSTVQLSPDDLASACGGKFADVTAE